MKRFQFAAACLVVLGFACTSFAQVFVGDGNNSVTVTVSSVTAGAGSDNLNQGVWGRSDPTVGIQATDFKIRMPASASTIDNASTYTYSFDARFTNFFWGFTSEFAVRALNGEKATPSFTWFGFADPKGNDGKWHHYSASIAVTDSDGSPTDWFNLTDLFIANIFNGSGGTPPPFTFEFDNLSFLGPDGQHLLSQVGLTVNQNAGFDNGDSILGNPINGSIRNNSQSFYVAPEPSTMALLGLGGMFLLRRRRI
jgi:hypothetical protein